MIHNLPEYIGLLIVVLIVLLVFLLLLDSFTGWKLVKMFVCSILFWVPFGAASAMNCYAIPV